MSTCASCARWTRHDYPSTTLRSRGYCAAVLPPWLTRWAAQIAPPSIENETHETETCDLHQQVEMQGDAEAIHGWGGQG